MVKQFGRDSHPIDRRVQMNEPPRTNRIPRIRRLRRAELPVDTVELARYLIGKTLVHDLPRGRPSETSSGRPSETSSRRLSGRIVETEAYPVGDPAGHAFTGRSLANNSLFLARGTAYIRFTYGVHWLFNLAAEIPGVGAGVLIRALEPLEGIPAMERNRGVSRLLDLARGPGRVAAAMKIDKRFDGLDVLAPASVLWLGTAARTVGAIGVSVRIGITQAAHRRLRFYERGSPFVSGRKSLNP
jgi:DNA-3-methyladenine glycosylase